LKNQNSKVRHFFLIAFAQCQHEEIIFPVALVDVISEVSVKWQNSAVLK